MLQEFTPHLLERRSLLLLMCGLQRMYPVPVHALQQPGLFSGDLSHRVASFLGGASVLGTYVAPAAGAADMSVIGRHCAWLKREGIAPTAFMTRQQRLGPKGPPPLTLAYPMAAAKFHKVPMGWRYIACSSTYTLRALSVWLTQAFRALMPSVDAMWNSRMAEAGVRGSGSWLLSDSRRVATMAREMNNGIAKGDREGQSLQTFDFAKMYTNIRLDVLKRRMRRLMGALFEFERQGQRTRRFLSVAKRKEKCGWVARDEGDSQFRKVFDADKLSRWFEYLVDNIYLDFAGGVLRQRIGIPMGTNCAVFVANLFCFTYEYAFITRLQRAGRVALIRQFRYTKRYIDDLLSGANPAFSQYLYDSPPNAAGVRGIYPRFLTVAQEQSSAESVSFLDTRFVFAQNRWFTDIYDKREHPPLSRVNSLKYPHPSSFLSARSKFGIITSRLCCFSRICQRKKDFIARARIFLGEFRERGYPLNKIRSFVLRFLKVTPLHFHVRSRHLLMRAMLP
jgi:hypothetical protein